ncbi:MAG: ABC transporter substrate binding protein [Aquificota bacterium]|nr:ABC transporter substrate binding protein [Aquificota bacterium]
MFPNIKKVLVFCNPQFEASKERNQDNHKGWKEVRHKGGTSVSVKDVKELEYIISHMKEDGFGAIIITPCFYTENFLTTYILHYANFYQIPVFCHSPGLVKKGCHVAYGTSGYEQGFQAAHIAYKILNGTPVEIRPLREGLLSPARGQRDSPRGDSVWVYNREFFTYVDEVVKMRLSPKGKGYPALYSTLIPLPSSSYHTTAMREEASQDRLRFHNLYAIFSWSTGLELFLERVMSERLPRLVLYRTSGLSRGGDDLESDGACEGYCLRGRFTPRGGDPDGLSEQGAYRSRF